MKCWNWSKEEGEAKQKGVQDEGVECSCSDGMLVGFVVDAKFSIVMRATVIDDLIGPRRGQVEQGC